MSRFNTFGAVLFFVLVSDLIAQDHLHLQLVGQLRTRGTSQYSNCWGYNAPNGKEYAIVGTGLGTQIVDITTDTLKEVAFIPGPSSSWREMKVYQKYAYVVTEGSGAGLQIIDLDSLKLVNTITTAVVPSGHTISIEGKYLYINGSRYKNGGIVVLDLTDPVNPVIAGEYQTQYIHDCIVKNDTIYAAAIYGVGLDIIDATNKANIHRINLVHYPYAGTHNADVTLNGKYVLTTDEINQDPSENGNVVRVWDKSNINNVTLAATYVAAPKTIAHNIHIKGNYGYVAHYTEGVRIIDISQPEIPVEVAYYDTYPGSANATIGNWGVFPYFNSNKIIATDMSGGLFVFKFPGQAGTIPVARGIITVVDSVTNAPLEGVEIELSGTTSKYYTDASGKVKFGALSDSMTLKLSKSSFDEGYAPRLISVKLPYHATNEVTVKLQKLPVGALTVTTHISVSGDAIAGAKVQIRDIPVEGVTDNNGTFTIASLIAGKTYRAVVTKFGFAVDSAEFIVAADTTTTVALSLARNGKDNFMFDLGWIVGNAADSGTAGRWERSLPKPIVIFGDTLQTSSGLSGANDFCYVTGPQSSLADNVEGRTSLISPVFSLLGLGNPTVIYWLFTNTRSVPVDDTVYVELSNNNGATWNTGEIIVGKQKSWTQHKITVNAVVTPTDQMRIRFVAKDGGSPSLFEAQIDDVEFGDNLQLSVKPHRAGAPLAFSLQQNYPNPFNPSTTIQYTVAEKGFITLKVFDAIGREKMTLVEGEQSAGHYAVQLHGTQLASGVYFVTLRAGKYSGTKKMILAK